MAIKNGITTTKGTTATLRIPRGATGTLLQRSTHTIIGSTTGTTICVHPRLWSSRLRIVDRIGPVDCLEKRSRVGMFSAVCCAIPAPSSPSASLLLSLPKSYSPTDVHRSLYVPPRSIVIGNSLWEFLSQNRTIWISPLPSVCPKRDSRFFLVSFTSLLVRESVLLYHPSCVGKRFFPLFSVLLSISISKGLEWPNPLYA
jgi:hypothetical protein